MNQIFYDYAGTDPVVPIRIVTSKASDKYLAYLDTGSDSLAIPRELWERFELSKDYPIRIQSVTGLAWSYVDAVKVWRFLEINTKFLR